MILVQTVIKVHSSLRRTKVDLLQRTEMLLEPSLENIFCHTCIQYWNAVITLISLYLTILSKLVPFSSTPVVHFFLIALYFPSQHWSSQFVIFSWSLWRLEHVIYLVPCIKPVEMLTCIICSLQILTPCITFPLRMAYFKLCRRKGTDTEIPGVSPLTVDNSHPTA